MQYDIRLAFFMVELTVATLLFSVHRGWHRSPRALVFAAIALCFGVRLNAYPLNLVAPTSSVWWAELCYYMLCVLVVMVELRFATRASWMQAMIMVCAGYTVQHIAYDEMKLLLFAVHAPASVYFTVPYYVVYALVYAAMYAVAWLVVARRFDAHDEALRHRAGWVVGGVGLLAFVIAANLLVGGRWNPKVRAVLAVYDLVCSVLALVELNVAAANDRLKDDVLTLQRVAQMQARHYEMTQANIEQINIKFHDLRKRLVTISGGGDGSGEGCGMGSGTAKADVSAEVQRAVTEYDSMFHTGSAALDVVLSEKGLYCSRHGIALTCMVDGSALDFMDTGDLYALFGNMLDNAVEGVSRLEDDERRVIDLSVGAHDGLLAIEERNYCVDGIRFADGLPLTSKGDTDLHGFGVRSMAHQVHKYGGSMQVKAQGGVFTVSIVFARP